jgi:ATP-dependent exoDNAse (exonuclease V) alpha subunit
MRPVPPRQWRTTWLGATQRIHVLAVDRSTTPGLAGRTYISALVRPAWYREDGHINYGYALTGYKAQGITVDRTFAVLGGDTGREWVYVVMSRGRESNRGYLLSHDTEEQCAHLSHQNRGDPLEIATSRLQR